MNKSLLFKQIQLELENVFQSAKDSAQRAYETATDKENEAENKYDTLGLEASYLAQGQSRRVAECEADLNTFKKFEVIKFSKDAPISMGALVCIEDDQSSTRYILLSPVAGGLKLKYKEIYITLITQSSPIGKALYRQFVGDDISVNAGSDIKHYQIISVD